jgi:hypothetical protein
LPPGAILFVGQDSDPARQGLPPLAGARAEVDGQKHQRQQRQQSRFPPAHAQGEAEQQHREGVRQRAGQPCRAQGAAPPQAQRAGGQAGQERGRQEAARREGLGMFAQQTHAPAAVAGHLAEQSGQAGPRVVAHTNSRGEPASHPRPGHAVVELHVLAGVEALVEQAHRLEHFPPVSDGHTLRGHETGAVGPDMRVGMMSEARGAGDGDSLLNAAGPGHLQRLRPAHAVGTRGCKGVGQVGQVAGVFQFAMAVDDDDDIASAGADGDVAAGAGPAARIVEQADVGVCRLEAGDHCARGVRRAAVGHEYLETAGVVVLADQAFQRAADESLLVAHRHDDGEERPHPALGRRGR